MFALIVLTVFAMLWIARERDIGRRTPDRIAIRVRSDDAANPRRRR